MLKIPNESLAAFGSLAGRLAKNAAWARSTNGNIALFKAYVGDDFMPVRPVDAIAAGACEGLAVITGSTRSEWRHYIVPNGLIAKVNEAAVKALCVNAGRRIRPDPERHHLPHAVRAAHGIPAQGRRDGLGLQL